MAKVRYAVSEDVTLFIAVQSEQYNIIFCTFSFIVRIYVKTPEPSCAPGR
jgi:hypothetical protein